MVQCIYTQFRMTNADRLRQIMREHGLTRRQVAEILTTAIGEPVSLETVHAWLRPASNRAARNMPAAKLKLLEMALHNKGARQ